MSAEHALSTAVAPPHTALASLPVSCSSPVPLFLCAADLQGGAEVFYVPTEARLKEDWSKFFQLERYQDASVREVLARSAVKRPPHFPVFRGFSTFSAVEQMARLGPHRLAVLDRERRVVGLLTQSMVISLLDQNIDKLGAFRESRVREMTPALASHTICVSDTALAMDAFKTMAANVHAVHSRSA